MCCLKSKAQGARLMAQGSRLKAHGTRRKVFLITCGLAQTVMVCFLRQTFRAKAFIVLQYNNGVF
jgi:hypothetical protein